MRHGDGTKHGVDRELLVESLVIMGIATVLFGITFTFDRVPEIFAQGIQPTVFPRAVLMLMFGLAALQAIKAIRLSEVDAEYLVPYLPIPKIVFFTGALLIVCVIAMRWVGTFPTLIVFCPTLALLWGERRGWMMLFGFSLFIAFAYVLFRIVMKVPLP